MTATLRFPACCSLRIAVENGKTNKHHVYFKELKIEGKPKQINQSADACGGECDDNLQQVLAGGVDFVGLYQPSLRGCCYSVELTFKH